MPKRKWNQAHAQNMKDAGNSYKWIAEHFGVKYSFAYNHLRPSSQATVYRGSVSLDQLEAWANGTQIQKLAEDAGVTPATMGRWLKAHPNYEEYLARRVPRVNREPQNMVARREQMAQEYKAGKSIDAIAELMDVSRQRVHQVLTKHYPELLEERRHQRLKAADDKQKAKLEKLAQRAKVQSQTAQAIELYKQGFTLTEFKHLFPDINWHTFTLHLTAMRQQDPSFPSERGRGNRNFNWEKRTIAAVKQTSTYVDAAKLLGVKYPTFMQRINKLRARGIKI